MDSSNEYIKNKNTSLKPKKIANLPLITPAACYICYNHFLQDGCLAAEGCVNEGDVLDTVVNGVSKLTQKNIHQ